MKNIKDYIITESSKNVYRYFDDFAADLGDSTETKGTIVIGFDGKKFEDFDKQEKVKIENEYNLFIKAYKDAGGTITEEISKQGAGEVFCKYSGKSDACKYILLNFLRILFN